MRFGECDSYAVFYSLASKIAMFAQALTLSKEAGPLCNRTLFLPLSKQELVRWPQRQWGVCDNASGNEFSNKNQMEDGQRQLAALRCNDLHILHYGKKGRATLTCHRQCVPANSLEF